MNSNSQDKQLERVAAALEQSTRDLDSATLSKLTQARHAAVAAAGVRKAKPWRSATVWAGSTAAVAAMALLMSTQMAPGPGGDTLPGTSDAVVDFELLASSDELEMLEDLEFFEWLGAEGLGAEAETG